MSVARSIRASTGSCATTEISSLSELLYSKSSDRASVLYTCTLSRLTGPELCVCVGVCVCVCVCVCVRTRVCVCTSVLCL